MATDLYRIVLPTNDMDGAAHFWSQLLELKVDALFPTRQYLHTAGAILALVDPAEHGQTAHPNGDAVYLRVPDLDAAWVRASELGAQMPSEYPGTGIATRDWGDRSFYCFDPFGNPACLIDDTGSEVPPEVERYTGKPTANLSSFALPTTSLGRAAAFYEAMLGLEADTFVPGRTRFFCDRCELSLVNPVEHGRAHQLEEKRFRANAELIYFSVDDLDATWEQGRKLGLAPLEDGHIGAGIGLQPWGERSFYGLDPSGNPICFVDSTTLFTGSKGL
jgi:catechol 2,3-dioxygenase-like lactoylglutathione lyase family enzyme